MKTLFTLIAFTLGTSAFAQNMSLDAQIFQKTAQLSDLVQRQQAHAYLSDNQKFGLLQNLNQALGAFQARPPQPQPRPQPGQPPYGYPGQGNGGYGQLNSVVTYSDDRCQAAITPITSRDDCSMLNSVFSNRSVWSVSVNGACYNTTDKPFTQSCSDLQRLASDPVPSPTAVTELFTDDRCQAKLVGLSQGMNFDSWSSVLERSQVWSVRVEGQCINIPDTTFSAQLANQYLNSALQMRGQGPQRPDDVFGFFTDDRCQAPLTNVSRGDNCQAMGTFFGVSQVWSISFRGQCQNITDTTFMPACTTYNR